MANGFGLKSKILMVFAMAFGIVLILGFLIATIVVLSISRDEYPNKPIRVWLGVSLGLWFLTTIIACLPTRISTTVTTVTRKGPPNYGMTQTVDFGSVSSYEVGISVVSKTVQLAIVAWWAVGLYWMISGGEDLLDRAPTLFWYTAVILGLGAAGGVIACCLCSCTICCGGIFAGILMRVNGEEADSRV